MFNWIDSADLVRTRNQYFISSRLRNCGILWSWVVRCRNTSACIFSWSARETCIC